MSRRRLGSGLAAATLLLVAAHPGTAHAICLVTELCGLPVQSTIEQPDLEAAVDVVLVGDGFRFGAGGADTDGWHAVAASVINAFKTQTTAGVYTAVPSVFNFHVVDVASVTTDVADGDTTDTALGMNVSGAVITASDFRAAVAATNAPDVDVVVTIANSSSGRANATYPVGLATGGAVRTNRTTTPISHELGHALFTLADEYVEAARCGPPTEAGLLKNRNVTVDATCTKFSTTAGAGCVQGGVYCASGVYRSASSCLMRSSGDVAMCPVCRRTTLEVLTERRTLSDVAEPWAVIVTPAPLAVVAGPIDLSLFWYDDGFVPAEVVFELDGVFLGATSATTFNAKQPLDTRSLADGTHSVRAVISDTVGHARASAAVTFSTANFTDSTAPSVSLVTPANGATVWGNVSIYATAGSAADVQTMVLRIDGELAALVSGRAYISHMWDATQAALGSHTVSVAATDYSQNQGGASVAVTVAAPPPPRDPVLFIQAPADWSAVAPLFWLRYMIGDPPAQGTAELLLDDVPLTPNPLPPLGAGGGGAGGQPEGGSEALIDASAWTAGPHRLQIRVTGGTAEISREIVVVRSVSSPPVAMLAWPQLGSGCQRGAIDVQGVAYADAGVSLLRLFVDDIELATAAGASASFAWSTTSVPDGYYALALRAEDTAGAIGLSPAVSVCVDNTPPEVSIVAPVDGAALPPGPMPVVLRVTDTQYIGRFDLFVDGALVRTAAAPDDLFVDLVAGSHTLTARATDSAGNSTTSPAVAVVVAACTASSCDDGDPCTADSCRTTGACLHVPIAGCCDAAHPCDDGDPCTSDGCDAGSCQSSPIAGCCNDDLACADADACTQDLCSGTGGSCGHAPMGCCAVSADCDDGNACTQDECINPPSGRCGHSVTPDCCFGASDCDDGDPCTDESCDTSGGAPGICQRSATPGCCMVVGDCPDDGDPCTAATCMAHACGQAPIPGCCVAAADCASLNPCVAVDCVGGRCTEAPRNDCCNFARDCDDANPCTDDACAANSCVNQPAALCCTADAECDDANPCSADSCGADRRCAHSPVAGCCQSPAECDDGDPCTDDACDASHLCAHAPNGACPGGDDGAVVPGDPGGGDSGEDPVPGDAQTAGDSAISGGDYAGGDPVVPGDVVVPSGGDAAAGDSLSAGDSASGAGGDPGGVAPDGRGSAVSAGCACRTLGRDGAVLAVALVALRVRRRRSARDIRAFAAP